MRTLHVPQDLPPDAERVELPVGAVLAYRNHHGVQHQRVLVSTPMVVFVRAGQKLLTVPGDTLSVQAGQMVLLPAGVHVMTETLPAAGPYASTLLVLRQPLLQGLAHQYLADWPASPAAPVPVVQTPTPYVTGLLEALARLVREPLDPRLLGLKVQELMLASDSPSARAFWAGAMSSAVTEGDARFRDIVTAHCFTPVGLQDLADLTGRSLSSFKRDFHRIFQSSPGRWLSEQRLGRARALLEHDACNVTEACWECGYADVSSFIRAFRRHFGVTPKQCQLARRGHRAQNLAH